MKKVIGLWPSTSMRWSRKTKTQSPVSQSPQNPDPATLAAKSSLGSPPDPFNPQGTDMKKFVLALAMTAAAAAPAFADLALASSKNCMACHAVDKKLVGPSYKDVAAKYKADKSAVDKLATKIVKGGSGVWGAVPMPANPQVNEAEAKKLAAWVLSAK